MYAEITCLAQWRTATAYWPKSRLKQCKPAQTPSRARRLDIGRGKIFKPLRAIKVARIRITNYSYEDYLSTIRPRTQNNAAPKRAHNFSLPPLLAHHHERVCAHFGH